MRTRLMGSKVSLLFVVVAALLLAVAGTTMALTADPSGNTAPAPTIQSDKDDYAPGETVTLTGGNWQPGESVHINVNDDEGQTWSRDVDVTADASGQIQDQFQLPNSFVATYKVTATGAQSGVATTSFTDGNVKFDIAPSNNTAQFVETVYNASTNCTGAVKNTFPKTLNNSNGDTVGVGNNESLRLDAAATSTQGNFFSAWSSTDSPAIQFTVIPNTGGKSICITGFQSGTQNFRATYVQNSAPVAHPQPLVSTNEDTAKTITLSATDADGNILTFAIVSGPTNGTLGSIGTVNCTGTAPKTCSANVTYTPNNNYNGGDSFTFKVNDGTGVANSDSLPTGVGINVNAVNDAPSFTKGADQTKDEDSGAQTVNGWATNISAGPNESGQTVSFEVSNSNTSLFSTQPAVSSNGTLTYTPAANASGTATVTVKAKDNGGTANGGVDTSNPQTFTITINAVNDAPSFTKGADETVNEDSGAHSVTGWATDISAGPADENGQTLNFLVTNDNNSLFTATGQPAVDASGKLTYESAPNAHGNATVTIKAKDSGGTANGGQDESASQTFTITVNSVNDAPSFTKGSDETVNEDSGAHSVTGWATNISAGPNESGQALNFIVSNNNNSLFTATGQPQVSANGTLSYTSAPDAYGTATVTVKLHDDGGTANGGADTSAEQTFTITINSVNDVPVANPDTKTTDEDTPLTFPSSDLVANDNKGAANESTQILTVTEVFNGTHGTVSLGTDGNITFTPEANFSGPATFDYRVCDNGSPSQCSVQTATVNVTVNAVNDNPDITSVSNSGPVNEGSPATITVIATDVDNPSSDLRYSFDCDNNNVFETGPQTANSSSCTFNDNGPRRVNVQVTDGPAGGSATDFTDVVVNNVAPTITGIAVSPLQALIGQPVSFTGTATDPSSVDTTAGFSWQWSKDGGAYAAGSNPFSTTFATCGAHSVSAKATDKDQGTSAPFTASTSVQVYSGNFLPPLQMSKDNLVQKGQVVPVKISVTGCDGINLAGLSPYIQLFSGDPTAAINEADFVVPTASVSAADTGQSMRPVADGYIYNLRVPSDAKATVGAKYYIRVSPFGTAAGQHMLISIQIRK